jgi:hypothetical protein
VIGIVLLSWELLRAVQQPKEAVTSKVVSVFCIVSAFYPSAGTDTIWFARRTGTRVSKLVRLPITRRDRNLPDVLHLNGNRAIAHVNGGVDLFEPFFLAKHKGRWSLVRKPATFEGCPGSSGVATIGAYQVCAVSCAYETPEESGPRSHIFIYGPAGLKYGRAKFVNDNRPYQFVRAVRNSGRTSIELEVWHNSTHGVQPRVKTRWVRVKWPFTAEAGNWLLQEVGEAGSPQGRVK